MVSSLMTLAVLLGYLAMCESSIKPDSFKDGCPGKNNRSHAVGEYYESSLDEDCSTYLCTVHGPINQSPKCSFNGGCYAIGENVSYNCYEHTCEKIVRDGKEYYEMSKKQIQCSMYGECFSVGDYHMHQCQQYRCVDKFFNGFATIIPMLVGCMDEKGVCYNRSDTIFLNGCHRHRCEGSRVGRFVYLDEYCQLDGKCHPLGHDYIRNGCDRFRCTKQSGNTVGYEHVKEDTCCVRGTVFQSGDTFSPPGDSDCVKFYCFKGNVNTVRQDTCCVRGTVFQSGDTFSPPGDSDCVKFYCFNGNVTTVRQGCQLHNTCLPLGISVEEECKNITCTRVPMGPSFQYHLTETRTGCEINNICIPFGVSVEQPCRTITCAKIQVVPDVFTYQPRVTNMACQLNNTCIPLGFSVKQQCVTLTCTKITLDLKLPDYQMLTTRTDCQFGDTCIPVGTVHYMNVCERYVCTNYTDGTVNYTLQKENTCCVSGTVFKDGETFTPPGASKCIKCSCSKGDVKYISEGCEYDNKCILLGYYLEHECRTAKCSKIQMGAKIDYIINVTKHACKLNDRCIPVGGSVEIECRTRTCIHVPGDFEFEYQMILTRTDCQYNDTCIPVGSHYYINGCERFICTNNTDGNVNYLREKENTCCVKGAVFDDQEIFTPPGESKCIEYQCSKGDIHRITEKCEYNNTCIDLGDDILETPCKKRICTKIPVGPEFNYKLVETTTDTCCVRGGVFDDQEIFTPPGESECVEYQCSKGDIQPITEKCDFDGACVALGTIVSIHCKNFTCAKIKNETEFTYKLIEAESGSVSGSIRRPSSVSFGSCCVRKKLFEDKEIFTPPGESSCVRYKCSNGNVKHVREQCKHNNKCFALGATTERDCKNVTCTKVPMLSENSFQWHETIPRSCCLWGKFVSDHEFITPPGITNNCNNVICIDGKYLQHSGMCEYKGGCYVIGHIIEEGCKKLVCKIIPMAAGDEYQFIQDNTTCVD